MKKKIVIVAVLIVGILFFLSQQKEGKLGEVARALKVDKIFPNFTGKNSQSDEGDNKSSAENESDQKDAKKIALDEKDGLGAKEEDEADSTNTSDDKLIGKKLRSYKPGGEIPKSYNKFEGKEVINIKDYNQTKLDTIFPETRWALKKSDCKDLIKTKKGASFTCRTRSKNKMGKAFIIHESSYDKNGNLIRFETKVQGVKESISFHGPSNIRKSQGKTKRSKDSSEKAARSVKFALEDRNFFELYLDENYMTEEVQYHYYDFKQAIITDDFYKEKDFPDRLDAVVIAIEKTMRMVQDQCKQGKYDKACLAYKKYQKINLREDAKKIISAAESSKIESAFFD